MTSFLDLSPHEQKEIYVSAAMDSPLAPQNVKKLFRI